MGQKLREDKIGALSHSTGSIVMAASPSSPAWLTIGGQQYKITSNLTRLIVTDLAMAANALYMVYAVRNAGNTELRVSANVNSVGPSGFSSWKLVGAFHTLSTVTFGCFVPITGSPPWKELSKQYGILEIKVTNSFNGAVTPGVNNWGEPDGGYRISPAESVTYDFETNNMLYHSGGGTLHMRLFNFTAGTPILYLGAYYNTSAWSEMVKIDGLTISIPAGNSLGIQMSPSTYIGGAPTSVGFYNAMNLPEKYMKLTKRMSPTPLEDL